MNVDEFELLRRAVNDAFGALGASPGAVEVDNALEQLGWLDMLEAEPDAAIAVVFEALGAANATSSALDDVFNRSVGIAPEPNVAMLLPPYATCEAPGLVIDETLHAAGIASVRASTADFVHVVFANEFGCAAMLVPCDRANIVPIVGIDPTANMHHVEVRGIALATQDRASDVWPTAVAMTQRAISHEILGATRAMLDLARTHAMERVQFDRPVVRFQAVRHRLAEALVAIAGLEAALGVAAEDPGPDTAQLAKAIAGQTSRTVAKHCQQILAGVGFTTDHLFHRYLKRTMLLAGLFGSEDSISLAFGRRFLEQRSVPMLIEL